ncbi:MAG: dCTP deaminase, partial [Candidatus Paceibacterota bacterium]
NLSIALSACTVDLRLGSEFEVFEHTKLSYFDIKKPQKEKITKKIRVKHKEPFIIHPGEFALAATREWMELPDDIAVRLEGRSSIGRLGIVVHSTAALFHPGFKGNLVLELGNHSRIPVALYPGMRICAVSFERLSTPAKVPYYKQKGAKYSGQKGVSASKISEES